MLHYPPLQVLATHHSIVDAIDLGFSALCGSLLPSMAFRLVRQQQSVDPSTSGMHPDSSNDSEHGKGRQRDASRLPEKSSRKQAAGAGGSSGQPQSLLAEAGVTIQFKRLGHTSASISTAAGRGSGRYEAEEGEEEGEEEEEEEAGWTSGLEQLSGGQRTMVRSLGILWVAWLLNAPSQVADRLHL
jgi:hypothetical protein